MSSQILMMSVICIIVIPEAHIKKQCTVSRLGQKDACWSYTEHNFFFQTDGAI